MYENNIFSFLEIPTEIGSKTIIKHNSTSNSDHSSDCNTDFGHPRFTQIKNLSDSSKAISCLILVSKTEESLQTTDSTIAGLK